MSYHKRLKVLLNELVNIGFTCDLDYSEIKQVKPFLGIIEASTRVSFNSWGEHQLDWQKDIGVTTCNVTFGKKTRKIREIGLSGQDTPTIIMYLDKDDAREDFCILNSYDNTKVIEIDFDQLHAFISYLKAWAYKEQGYTVSIPLAQKASIATILCLMQYIPKDLAKLVGQYVYKTRYEVNIWK